MATSPQSTPQFQAEPKSSQHLVNSALIEGLNRGFSAGGYSAPSVAEMNAQEPNLRFEERTVPGLPASPPVPVVVITPKNVKADCPALLFIHGGGYTMGTPLNLPGMFPRWATALGFVTVSVAYRLAPQTAFPGALNDNYAALKWLYENAESLGVDRRRIATFATSAGGGHAVMMALHASGLGEVPILKQFLMAPMLDDRTGSTRDPGPYAGEFVWQRESNRDGWTAMLGVEAGSDAVPVGASPGRFPDLSRMPPTFITVGSLDLFAQENLEFAARLIRAGVPTELHVWDGAFHGSSALSPDAPVTMHEAMAIETALRGAFEHGPRDPSV